jgi:hypothetical protein
MLSFNRRPRSSYMTDWSRSRIRKFCIGVLTTKPWNILTFFLAWRRRTNKKALFIFRRAWVHATHVCYTDHVFSYVALGLSSEPWYWEKVPCLSSPGGTRCWSKFGQLLDLKSPLGYFRTGMHAIQDHEDVHNYASSLRLNRGRIESIERLLSPMTGLTPTDNLVLDVKMFFFVPTWIQWCRYGDGRIWRTWNVRT